MDSSEDVIQKKCKQILDDQDMMKISRELRAKIHHIIGLAKFVNPNKTYQEVKTHLKGALKEAQNPEIRSSIMHNLMIVNYCEIIDHNDRVHDNQGEI